MDLDDLTYEMVVLQPLIESKSTSWRTLLKHSGPLRFEEVCFIILLEFVFVDQYNPSGWPKPCGIGG